MPSANSKVLSELIDVSFELSEVITAEETFHPRYKANRDTFRRFIAARGRFEKAMRKYFREASDRIFSQIDWFAYEAELVQAQEYVRNIDWEGEQLQLTVTFAEVLPAVYQLGIEHMEENSGVTTGLNTNALRFQREISKHGLDLAKGLNQTTRDRVNQILKTSLSEHRTVEEAAARMVSVIEDPNRARMIARTETVNGHSRGIVTAGRELGAKEKRWLTAGNPCPICQPLDGKVVPIDKPFETAAGPKDGPTAHPYCLCLVENVF